MTTTINSYEPGDIVWVKLSNSWWPGEVWNQNEVPDDLSSLKRKPIAVVKFFKEDSYEYVKNTNSIYAYKCQKKHDFIKKGLDINRRDLLSKFREDVITAEKLTGGNVNIFENIDLERRNPSSTKKPNIVKMIFGDTSTNSNQKKLQKQKSKRNSFEDKSPKMISRLKGQSIVTVKNIMKPSPKNSQQSQIPDLETKSSTPTNSVYKCHLCSFSSMRQNVIILHSKIHINRQIQLNTDPATYTDPKSINSKSNTSTPKESVIVIDDDSDIDDLTNQTSQNDVSPIETTSELQVIELSLSSHESFSPLMDNIPVNKKTTPAIERGTTEKTKRQRGNKSVTIISENKLIESNENSPNKKLNNLKSSDSDHIPLIKPPKKQFRKGIIKDIFEDWSDEDSTMHNNDNNLNKSSERNFGDLEKLPEKDNISENLGVMRLNETDVEVLKNLQIEERSENKRILITTTKKIRNIPKKDRLRNIVLEEYSDSSSNVTLASNLTETLKTSSSTTSGDGEIIKSDVKLSNNHQREENNSALIIQNSIENKEDLSIRSNIDQNKSNFEANVTDDSESHCLTSDINNENEVIEEESIRNKLRNKHTCEADKKTIPENLEVKPIEDDQCIDPGITKVLETSKSESNIEISIQKPLIYDKKDKNEHSQTITENLTSQNQEEKDQNNDSPFNEINFETNNIEIGGNEKEIENHEKLYKKCENQDFNEVLKKDKEFEIPKVETRLTRRSVMHNIVSVKSSKSKRKLNKCEDDSELSIKLLPEQVSENSISLSINNSPQIDGVKLEDHIVGLESEKNLNEKVETTVDNVLGCNAENGSEQKLDIPKKSQIDTTEITISVDSNAENMSEKCSDSENSKVRLKLTRKHERKSLIRKGKNIESNNSVSISEVKIPGECSEEPIEDQKIIQKELEQSEFQDAYEKSLKEEIEIPTRNLRERKSRKETVEDESENVAKKSNSLTKTITKHTEDTEILSRSSNKDISSADAPLKTRATTKIGKSGNDLTNELKIEVEVNESKAKVKTLKALKTSTKLVKQEEGPNEISSTKKPQSALKELEKEKSLVADDEKIMLTSEKSSIVNCMETQNISSKLGKNILKKSKLKEKTLKHENFAQKDTIKKNISESGSKGESSAAVFEFQDEDDTELVMTSLSKLKNKYLSPDKSKKNIPENIEEIEKRKKIETEDEKLKVEIENLLKETTSHPEPIFNENQKETNSISNSFNENKNKSSQLTDEVRTLPIKERGKRFFKSRNVSRSEDLNNTSTITTMVATTDNQTQLDQITTVSRCNKKDTTVFEHKITFDTKKGEDSIILDLKNEEENENKEDKEKLKQNDEEKQNSQKDLKTVELPTIESEIGKQDDISNVETNLEDPEKIESCTYETKQSSKIPETGINLEILNKSENELNKSESLNITETNTNIDSIICNKQSENEELTHSESPKSPDSLKIFPQISKPLTSADNEAVLSSSLQPNPLKEIEIQTESSTEIKNSEIELSPEARSDYNGHRRRSHLKVTPRKRFLEDSAKITEEKESPCKEMKLEQSEIKKNKEEKETIELKNLYETLCSPQSSPTEVVNEKPSEQNIILQETKEICIIQDPIIYEELVAHPLQSNKQENNAIESNEIHKKSKQNLPDEIENIPIVLSSETIKTRENLDMAGEGNWLDNSHKTENEENEKIEGTSKINDRETEISNKQNEKNSLNNESNDKDCEINNQSIQITSSKINIIENSEKVLNSKNLEAHVKEQEDEQEKLQTTNAMIPEDIFVEKYMKETGSTSISSNEQIKNISKNEPDENPVKEKDLVNKVEEIDKTTLTKNNSLNPSTSSTDEQIEQSDLSLEDIKEKQNTSAIEKINNKQEDNLPKIKAAIPTKSPLLEQARAIVAKVNSPQTLFDIRSFRPKKKTDLQSRAKTTDKVHEIPTNNEEDINLTKQQIYNKSNIVDNQDSDLNKNLEEKLMNETNEINSVTNNSNAANVEDKNNEEAKDSGELLETATKTKVTIPSKSPSELVKESSITTKSEIALNVRQIENNQSLKIEFKKTEPSETDLVKKRKLSIEEDIPTFIIEKNSSIPSSSPNNKHEFDKSFKIQKFSIDKSKETQEVTKQKVLISQNVSNTKNISKTEVVSPIVESSPNLTSSSTTSTVSGNILDISSMPILLTSNPEEPEQDSIHLMTTTQLDSATPLVQHHYPQQMLSSKIENVQPSLSANQSPIKQFNPIAKRVRGRPRKMESSALSTNIESSTNVASNNNGTSSKFPSKSLSLTNDKEISKQNHNLNKFEQNESVQSTTNQVLTTESGSQTVNIKPTSARELGIDSSGNSIVLIQYGKNSQKLLKMPKTAVDLIQTSTPAIDGTDILSENNEVIIETVHEKLNKTQNQIYLQQGCSFKDSDVTNQDYLLTKDSSKLNSGVKSLGVSKNQPIAENEILITPIFENENLSQSSNQCQSTQVTQNPVIKTNNIQKVPLSPNDEINDAKIKQTQEQLSHDTGNSVYRNRKRKELDSKQFSNQSVIGHKNKMPKLNQSKSIFQSSPLNNSCTQISDIVLSSSSLTEDFSEHVPRKPSAISNTTEQTKQPSLQKLQQQQTSTSSQQQLSTVVQQQQQQIQPQQQNQPAKSSTIEEEIAANKIMAVPANHFGIPGNAYYLCSQDNEGNYMPIDNQELYLDPESNQLVPLSVLNAKGALTESTEAGDFTTASEELSLKINTPENEAHINESRKHQEQANVQDNIGANNAQGDGQQFIQTNNITADELSNILSPDQSICINIDGQQLILDQQSFLALVAAGGENTQLETQDGQILQLTGEFLSALGIGVNNNENNSTGDLDTENSSVGEHQILLRTANEEIVSNNDILTSALIDDVLQIETSQGVQLALTQPVTAQTSETNALLTQPPIMSTLETPSNKKAQNKHVVDSRQLILNTMTEGTVNQMGRQEKNINSSERVLTTPQNLEDCIAFIGVSTQASTVPSSLELPITVTNPAIAPPPKATTLGSNLFNTKNLIVESNQISPNMDDVVCVEGAINDFTSQPTIGNLNFEDPNR